MLSLLSFMCQSQTNSLCGIFIPAVSKSARGKMRSYHPALTTLQCKLPVLPLCSSLHHCHITALTVLPAPEKSYQDIPWESSHCQRVPTDHFKSVGTGTSEALTRCAFQQRPSHTSSSWRWNHPKTSSTAQNFYNSSFEIFGSRPTSHQVSFRGGSAGPARAACTHVLTAHRTDSLGAALTLCFLDDELFDLLAYAVLHPHCICS